MKINILRHHEIKRINANNKFKEIARREKLIRIHLLNCNKESDLIANQRVCQVKFQLKIRKNFDFLRDKAVVNLKVSRIIVVVNRRDLVNDFIFLSQFYPTLVN